MADELARTVLFLCTGNYFRSRFAEHLFNALAHRRELPWRAISRGIQAWRSAGDGAMSSFAISSLAVNGIELVSNPRLPLQLAEEDLERSDLAIAVNESEHRAMIAAQFPGWEDRIDYWAVDDINNLPPHECLRKCEESVSILVQMLVDASYRFSNNQVGKDDS